MEKNNITLDPSSSFGTSSSADINVPPEGMVQRSSRIKRIQTTAMILLFFAAVINYLDRSSLSVANLTIREELGLSATQIGVLLSVFSLAYGIAQLPCGPLLDRKGPRIMLGLGMFFWSLFQAMSGMVHSFTQFVLVRIGMGIGEAPMNPCGVKVINDWFNIKERGRPMGLFNAASTIGVAISPPILAAMMLVMGWRWMFGAELVPALAFLVLMFFVPESPRWLAKDGQYEKASRMLSKIGGDAYAKQTLAEIRQTLVGETHKVSLSELGKPSVRPILIIGIVLAVFQQWCGINVIFNYAQEIFASAGFDINSTLKSIVATGLINLLFTLIALPMVDKIGRRKLMLIGSAGLTIIYGMMAAAYASGVLGLPVLLLVLTAIAIYALTLAPVTWVLLSEIFPNRVRGLAMSAGTLALWIACFVLTYTFPLLNAGLGAAGSFLLYGLICFAGLIFIYRKVPETKGVTLEALEAQLAQGKVELTPAKASTAV